MSNLLDKIIEATEKRGTVDFNRSLEYDELKQFRKDFNEEDESEKEILAEDSFFLYVNKRLLRLVFAKLGQIEYQLIHFYPFEKVKFICSSLSKVIKAFDKSYESYEFLFSNLHNKDHLSLQASVFVIASIYNCPDAYFNKLLYYFAHCEDEYLIDYEKALSLAPNPSLSSRLLTILPFCSDSVFQTGLKILSFRSDISIEDWRQLTSDKKDEFKYFGMLERVKLNDRDALEYIEKKESIKYKEERMRLLLINGKREILDLCRENIKSYNGIEKYHLKFLRIAGDKSDIIHLTRLFYKSEPDFKREIIETIGAFQCAESLEFFLEIIDNEEDFHFLIFKDILNFTSIDFTLCESPVDAFKEWCENELFKYRNNRIYKREVWSHKSHIDALRNEKNNGEKRLTLWSELSARGGHRFNLNPSWTLERQEKIINKIDLWFDENRNNLINPWNYMVS